jgi:hypothetical protein
MSYKKAPGVCSRRFFLMPEHLGFSRCLQSETHTSDGFEYGSE